MSNVAPDGFGSTALNPRIESYADLVFRTKSLLGWPAAPLEITDMQWAHIIDNAIEVFTEFEGNREEEYLIFCSNNYKRNCGVKLDDLLNVRCNSQHCYETTYVETVTSTRSVCEEIQTSTAYLSTTPFVYPTQFNYLNPNAVEFSGVSGQNFHLYFDPENPWDALGVCGANCVTINPVNSRWYLISSNPNLSGITFDFTTPPLSFVLSSVSYDEGTYGYTSVPLSALGDSLSAIPIRYYPLSAFYPPDEITGPEVSACVNIGRGSGYIYPNCDISLISACAPLTAQYGLSPSVTATWPLSSRDFSDNTHVRLKGVPPCTTDGSIPLNSNDGILATFTLCNTAFSTNGPMKLKNIQFFNDFKPPAEILYDQNCDWTNNGFTFSYYNSAYTECVRHTPRQVQVDVTFSNCQEVTEIGTVVHTTSSNIDTFINRKRKILGVFNADDGGQGGYFGGSGDMLFNFDYALLANSFGFNMMGGRMGGQGYDLLTYHMARTFVEHSKKMLRYVSYQFNPRTQYLKLMPEPAQAYDDTLPLSSCNCSMNSSGLQCYIVGLYVEPPVEHILSSYFIKEYVLALAMITLGRIRSTFGGVTLYGGATLAGQDLLAKGEDMRVKLMAELRDEMRYSAPPGFFIG